MSRTLPSPKNPPNTYRHFVDDGIGNLRDKSHADGFLNFLNSLTDDLQYTIEYPSEDGNLSYMDILMHPDKYTSEYRKPTHTNISVPLLLQRQCHPLQDLQTELTVYTT